MKSSVALLSIMLALQPLAASAAVLSPQRSLDRALASFSGRAPLKTDLSVTYNVIEKALGRSQGKQTSSGDLHLSGRALPKVNDAQNMEGQLRLTVDQQPIILDWKMVDKVYYLRLVEPSNQVLAWFALKGVDPELIVGQWIRVSAADKSTLEQTQINVNLDTYKELIGSSAFWKQVAGKSLLRITRVEKRERRANGHEILRLRVVLNPQLITLWAADQIKQIKPGTRGRQKQIDAINKQATSVRAVLAKISMVAVVDTAAISLDRFEAGLKSSDPIKSCTWNNKTHRSVCRTTGNKVTSAALGVSFLSDAGMPIEAPASSLSVEEMIRRLEGTTVPAEPAATSTPETATSSAY